MVDIARTQVIDVSQLPAPDAIKDLSYETILADRKTSLISRFQAIGIDYDVSALESDPGVVLQEEDAYRQLLDEASINDSVRAVLPAFAKSTNLEAIVARANIIRQTVTPADPTTGAAAVMESDPSLLQRYLATFSAPSAGSEDAYIIAAASAFPGVRDVRVLGYPELGREGRIEIILLAEGGADVTDDQVVPVRSALAYRQPTRPLTDVVTARAATINRWSLSATLEIRRGPSPDLVIAQAEAALRKAMLDRYFVGGFVPSLAQSAPLFVPNVVKVTPMGAFNDIPAVLDGAPWLDGVTLIPQVQG